MRKHRWLVLLMVWISAEVAVAQPADESFVNPKANIGPKAQPIRRSAAETIPPLPMPATPLRRSEKKREPTPPALIGSATFPPSMLGGRTWETTAIDIEPWIAFTSENLGQQYRFATTDFAQFSYDPAELPILYLTGWRPLPQFDDGTIEKLRRFIADGGTWIIHSNCGRREFNDSFRREIMRIFPDRQLAPVGADHPIYWSFHAIKSMRVYVGKEPVRTVPTSAGLIETINIGTRAAVIFSPIDMSCGWDASAQPIEGGILFDMRDARQLGANIVTYALAEYPYGRLFGHAKPIGQAPLPTRDQLVLGQVMHNGDWDATPHGLPNLLRQIDQRTTLRVQFKRALVDLEKTDLFSFPVLYLSGQRQMGFSPEARKRLRAYLDRGGSLVVDCVIGSSEFDAAFRREMAAIYPDRPLRTLPADHAIYTFVDDAKTLRLAPLANQMLGREAIPPQLEAIDVDGRLAVVYSKLSASAGWERLPRAYNLGYADDDAMKLGVNVLMYVASH